MEIGIIVPIFICVILPVSIVLIIALIKINSDNRRSQILLKAIESNNEIDADKLAASLSKPQKSARELANARLLRGCIFSLVGAVLLVVGLINTWNGGMDADFVSVLPVSGGCLMAVGVSYLVVYMVTRKQLNEE